MIELRHADTLPYLAVRLRPAVRTVDVYTGPAGHPVRGVTDPRELRAMAWRLLESARWLDRQAQPGPAADDSQTTIFDLLEVS